jgi:pimeloyl-ACP methyl ester carboxylesterase
MLFWFREIIHSFHFRNMIKSTPRDALQSYQESFILLPVKQRRYITDSGGNGDPIILLHGFLSSSKYWNRLRPHLLEAGYRVITIDLLGFGNASKPTTLHYSYDDHLAHIHSAITSLGLTRFTLVGHSMGALLASRYSIVHPKEVQTLLLLHPPLFKNRAEANASLRATGKFYRFLLGSRFRSAGWAIIRIFSLHHISAHNQSSREGSLRNVIESAQMSSDFLRISVQTKFLIGTQDRKEYTKNAKNLPVNPHVELVSHNVKHHSPISHPQLVMSLLTDS